MNFKNIIVTVMAAAALAFVPAAAANASVLNGNTTCLDTVHASPLPPHEVPNQCGTVTLEEFESVAFLMTKRHVENDVFNANGTTVSHYTDEFGGEFLVKSYPTDAGGYAKITYRKAGSSWYVNKRYFTAS